jgi:Ca2+-binding EF-hand superfamily protein
MVVKVYESILRSDLTLKQTIAEFDPDGDGVVSAWEFRKALQVAQVDIPESQVLTADTTITLHAS